MLAEIDTTQTNIMLFIKRWVNTQKTPVPRKEIVKALEAEGNNRYTTIHALSSLIIKGFIRRAYSEKQNQTFYVMIRNI